jgi:hypothetical protein
LSGELVLEKAMNLSQDRLRDDDDDDEKEEEEDI